jgi:hypothetical protein
MLRGFTDGHGVDWRVWEVYPSRAPKPTSADSLSRSSLKETPYANGWLCFESTTVKRRLAPIPTGWEYATAMLLQQYCDQAEVVPLRREGRFVVNNASAPVA